MSKNSYDVIIIGGGAIGVSIAYHLANKGCNNVLVLEKEPYLGACSTSKAAGGIRAQFSTKINIQLSMLSIEMFEKFSNDVSSDFIFFQNGYLFLISTEKDEKEFLKNVDLQRSLGVDVKILNKNEIEQKFSYVESNGLIFGTFHARDGYASPMDFLQGYAKKATDMKVKFKTSSEVVAIKKIGNKICSVLTKDEKFDTGIVVCAAGAFSKSIGEMVNIDIPIVPVRRQVFVTKPIKSDNMDPKTMPLTIDVKTGVYIHGESGGVLIGWADPDEPPSFNTNTDQKFLEKLLERALERFPILQEAEILRGWGGLYEVTPDFNPILDKLPDLDSFFIAAGFSGHGFMHAPATGLLMADLILNNKTSIDLSPLSLSRFNNLTPNIEKCVI